MTEHRRPDQPLQELTVSDGALPTGYTLSLSVALAEQNWGFSERGQQYAQAELALVDEAISMAVQLGVASCVETPSEFFPEIKNRTWNYTPIRARNELWTLKINTLLHNENERMVVSRIAQQDAVSARGSGLKFVTSTDVLCLDWLAWGAFTDPFDEQTANLIRRSEVLLQDLREQNIPSRERLLGRSYQQSAYKSWLERLKFAAITSAAEGQG